jgi:hypothetical protein
MGPLSDDLCPIDLHSYSLTVGPQWTLCQVGCVLRGIGAGEGIRTSRGLLGRHIALSGVAARMARGAKSVQLSSREIPRIVVWHR